MSALTVPSDAEIVTELADELIRVHRLSPFRFGISYDAKKEPARVVVHKVVKNSTGGEVEFTSAITAHQWCVAALKEGYSVERLVGRDVLESNSLAQRRRYYEQITKYQSISPAERKALDDEIPF
jgi:hypothetical protein